MPRPIQARVDLGALQHNYRLAQGHAAQSNVMVVAKANAYGHGLLRTMAALHQAPGVALLDIKEAIELREAGYRGTILLLEGFFDREDLRAVQEYRLATVVHGGEQLRALTRSGAPSGLEVYLKINTGMNRLGFRPEEVASVLTALRQARLGGLTLMTHFATADEARGVSEQLSVFRQVTAGLPYPSSLANSAALLRYPQTHAQWVRPGIMLYGSSPFADCPAAQLGLKPVMTLTSRLIAVQNVDAGAAIGYGESFIAERTMRVGVVACGYADGYPRHAKTGTPVLIEGARSGLVGRVSMDMLTVDVSHLPEARVGSAVTLWGEGLPIDEVAQHAQTVSYELLTKVTRRVPVRES
jgi:alanine racemase